MATRWWAGAELVGWSVTAAVGLVVLTQVSAWPELRLVTIVQSLTPYLGVVVTAIAVLALWRRRFAMATTAIAVGVGIMTLSLPLLAPGAQPAAHPDAVGLRIASLNLLESNDRVDEAADVLLDVDADVIVFVEYTDAHELELTQHLLAARYLHRIERSRPGAGGIAVWSRRPVTEADPPPTHLDSIDATIDHVDGAVRVVAIHVPTPTSDYDAWRRDFDVVERIGRAADEPIAVVGDLNATYWHPEFRSLLDVGFTDAHIAAGRGFSTSWPTGRLVPPFVQLDHALTTDGLVSTDIADVPVPGSDHRGFVVTVAPARPGAP